MTILYGLLALLVFFALVIHSATGDRGIASAVAAGILFLVGFGAVASHEHTNLIRNRELEQLQKVCVEAGLATCTPVIEVTNFRLLATSTINAENK